MAKARIDTHLKEDDAEDLVKALLPKEWVIRKLHPDYGVDVTIEVFERNGDVIPSLGEFLFVQLKGTTSLTTKVERIRSRGNVEKAVDTEEGEIVYDLDAVTYVVDSDTIDNARQMGPSSPLMLFVCDLAGKEVYFICLTDYYDKVLEPRGYRCEDQDTVTVVIPRSNRLSVRHSVEVMRLFAARAKLYGMFNLAQFQYREMRHLLPEIADGNFAANLASNISIIDRFARRLRGMPIWDRELPWELIEHYRDRLDLIIRNLDAGALNMILDGLKAYIEGDDKGLNSLKEFHSLCAMSWEHFSAIGQSFEDINREWFLPTSIGQACSGESEFLRARPLTT